MTTPTSANDASDTATTTTSVDAKPAATADTSAPGGAQATETPSALAGTTEAPKGDEGKKTEAAAPAPLELKLPDGMKMADAELAGVKKLFEEAGLDSARGQKLFDGYLAIEKARTAESEKAFAAQNDAWAKAIQADADIGGSKWTESQQLIGRAFKHFGPAAKEAQAVLVQAGLGNNPALVKFFVSLGRALKEDTVAGTASAAPTATVPYERAAYPTMFPKEP